MTIYKLLKSPLNNEIKTILKNETDSIPFDPANTDYQAYLKWLEEGNTPLPAENT